MRFDKHFITRALPDASVAFERFPEVVEFVTDSREASPGAVFVALNGIHRDGHDFIVDAFEQGAVGCIIAESKKSVVNTIKGIEEKLVVTVKDPLEAFIHLAIEWRSQFSYPVLAITGSVGKTSTKEFVSRIMLNCGKNYFVSHENQNTKIGVALNMLRLKEDHELAIFEIGISKRGEMAELAEMLQPTTAVITNIGHQHMDGLGSLNDIALEKRDVFKYLTEKSIGIVNGDQSILSRVSYRHPVVRFGSKTTNQIQARKIRIADSQISFILKIYQKKYFITLNRPHTGAVFNALAATAAAHWLGVPDDIIVAAIQQPCVVEGRFEERAISGDKGILINDCYNANPESMKAALLAFQQIETTAPKIAILGDMLGLGVNSPFWHRQVGRFLRKAPSLNKVILVGELVSWVKKTSPVGLPVEIVATWKEAVEKIEADLSAKPAVLVKGSRAVGLDNLVEILTKKDGARAPSL
jgi:UDP-N-acetylmuramoyl-tripeptide--D-alanyl-D-alanine ligase